MLPWSNESISAKKTEICWTQSIKYQNIHLKILTPQVRSVFLRTQTHPCNTGSKNPSKKEGPFSLLLSELIFIRPHWDELQRDPKALYIPQSILDSSFPGESHPPTFWTQLLSVWSQKEFFPEVFFFVRVFCFVFSNQNFLAILRFYVTFLGWWWLSVTLWTMVKYKWPTQRLGMKKRGHGWVITWLAGSKY